MFSPLPNHLGTNRQSFTPLSYLASGLDGLTQWSCTGLTVEHVGDELVLRLVYDECTQPGNTITQLISKEQSNLRMK